MCVFWGIRVYQKNHFSWQKLKTWYRCVQQDIYGLRKCCVTVTLTHPWDK